MAQAKNKRYCSVPHCFSYGLKQPYLNFHSFPKNEEVRQTWVQAIRREEGPSFVIKEGSTHVCSLHFTPADYVQGLSVSRLKTDAVPSLFSWNEFTPPSTSECVYDRCYKRQFVELSVLELESQQKEAATKVAKLDHDYATPPPAGVLDEVADHIKDLKAKLKSVSLPSPYVFSQYCVSDSQIRFYTKFPSERVFKIFWEHIAPSASRLIYWSKAKRKGEETIDDSGPSPSRSMPLIDEFFMYSMRIAVGMKEQLIADMFQTSVATVSRVTITWANYLFSILGTIPLWMSRDKIRSVMPEKFKKHCPNVRVTLDCTEIAVATASSLTLQSEMFSHYKNRTTLKALIGVTPHGFVSFFSKLYTGSISDKEITKLCGILLLLEPGDEVMADKGFVIDDLLSGVGAKLIIPPFKHTAQFTREDAEKTQAIARLRIVVERVIGRIKSNHIWDSPVPLTLMGTVCQIWHNCCVMANFQGPLSSDE
ncbi:uncharacterized protein LOC141792065 [Halichoeres trimaculatus]|uniref:uncharacterized protein LOC141792065 n=1 Tax=Halichoeres trimaculatus TaxID=147232 RepID=UPI003D9EDC91